MYDRPGWQATLCGSYRFPPEIAFVANAVLKQAMAEPGYVFGMSRDRDQVPGAWCVWPEGQRGWGCTIGAYSRLCAGLLVATGMPPCGHMLRGGA